MKVYKFFKIPDENDVRDNIDLEQKYVLYAMTNNKEYAERFKEDRNMKKFIYKVYSGVDKEEYAEMCNHDRGSVLELRSLVTIFDNHTMKNAVKKKVLMTYWEYQLMDQPNTILDDEESWKSMPYPLIFKSKYVKMLEALQYVTYYKLMTCEFLPIQLIRKLTEFDDDYSAPSMAHDEVALFIAFIQDTL